MSKFNPLRKYGETISGILPATALAIGTPLKVGSVAAGTGARTFVLADGYADGFVTRASRVSATQNPLTDSEILFGQGVETPFRASFEGSIECLSEGAFGDDYLVLSGTGAISDQTAADTELSFAGGKFRVAQAEDRAQYRLVAQLTPEGDDTVYIHVKLADGALVPA